MIVLVVIFLIFEIVGVLFPKMMLEWTEENNGKRLIIDFVYLILTIWMILTDDYMYHGLLLVLISSIYGAIKENKLMNKQWYRVDAFACALILLHTLENL